jgi:hypothetical protein
LDTKTIKRNQTKTRRKWFRMIGTKEHEWNYPKPKEQEEE